MHKAPVSAAIIAKNEEKMLFDCLNSISNYVMEIVLVDTGSNDRTKKIAEEFGCKIIDYIWNDDFSEARNLALDNCSQPFILSIDADERLTNPEILPQICMHAQQQTAGWLVHVVSESLRQDGMRDKFVSNLLRFFRNDPRIRFQGIIHEQVHYSILEMGLSIQDSPLQFIHLGYSNDVKDMNLKQKRNLELLNKVINSNPSAYNYFQRGKTLLALNMLKEAEEDLDEAIKLLDKGNNVLLPQILNFGAVIATRLGLKDIAKQRAEMSLSIIPNQAFAYYAIAELYFENKDFEKALQNYLKLDEMQAKQDLHAMIAGDYRMPNEELAYKIGKCYFELKDITTAEKYFKVGFQINNLDLNNITGLANIHFLAENYDTADKLMTLAVEIDPKNQNFKHYLNLIREKLKPTSAIINSNLNTISESGKPLLSLCMIVKNEENMLDDCLSNVQGIVDEIVIVDTGSNDNTVNIAKKYGARIFEFSWVDDFSAARNEALRNCKGDWILYLDADERLNLDTCRNLRDLLTNSNDDIGGYLCTIESSHLQLDNSTELHRGAYPRIFRNYGYPTIKFQGRVHEQIGDSIFALGKSIGYTDIIITHLGYDTSREIMEAKVRRNYQLLLKHINEEPLNAYAWFQLGQTLAQMKIIDEAEKAIRFSIELGSLSDSVYASATATLSQIVGGKRNFTEALNWAEKSLEKAPDQVFALSLKGFALLLLNRKKEAEQIFVQALERNNNKSGIPQSGFDIQVPEKELLDGLNRSRN